MSRSIQSRRTGRKNLRSTEIRSRGDGKRALSPTRGIRDATPRLIGLPVTITVPNLKGLRGRYCSRWDEQPAALLGKSWLRLQICRAQDWSGSAVDFLERGFRRFCRANGAGQARKIWSGCLRIMDHPFELTEQERNSAEVEEPVSLLYLVGEYDAAASIPIAPTLALLEREHALLPAAFYRILVHNLWKWMRVFDYSDALAHAEMWMEEMEEPGEAGSPYPNVRQNIPACLKKHAKMGAGKARRLLQEIEPAISISTVRSLVKLALAMDAQGHGYEHAWPGRLAKLVPAVQDFLDDADGCGPGCLISWYEDDEVSACFEEQMRDLGQNGAMEPSILLTFQLHQPAAELDDNSKRVLDYAGAMLRSLALAANIVDIVRELHDEHLRQHRIKSGLQVEPGPAGVRDQQL
jgi:hypothetical protein